MKKEQKLFMWAALISAFIWSVAPLLRQSLPMDTQEAIVWGKYCLWGTTKHPPFSGWLSYGFYRLLGQTDFSMYLLSQICVLLGLYGIYKLAKYFLSETQAVLATAFQLGIIFYHFSATEFNVNVVSLAIWPWCTYFFWRAYINDKLKDWLLFGVLMGINILNKYVGGVLGIAFGVFVLMTPKAQKLFKNPKAYLSVLICLIVCLPHLLWLYETDFGVLNYIATRNPTGKITSFLKHFVYPLKFMAAQVLFVLPALITFYVLASKQRKIEFQKDTETSRFLLCIGIIPTLFWVVKSALWGTPLKDMWNFPSLFVWGILFFYFIRREWNDQKAKQFIKAVFVWSMVFAFVYAGQCVLTKSVRFQSNCRQITRDLIERYEQKTHQKIHYVGGNIWFSDMLSLYAEQEVKPMIWLNPKANPWFDEKDFNLNGALVVAENKAEYDSYKEQFKNNLTNAEQMDIIYQNRFGKTKTLPVYWGVYKGEKNEK